MRAMKSTTSFVCVTSFHLKYLCGKNFSIFKFLSLLVLYLHHIRLKSISLCTHMFVKLCSRYHGIFRIEVIQEPRRETWREASVESDFISQE